MYGHSLGAIDATVIYNKGYLGPNDRVTLYAPPTGIHANALMQSAGAAQLTMYCGSHDWICNRVDQQLTQERNNAGTNIQLINTGEGALDPHSRCRYQYAETNNGVANGAIEPECRW